MNSVRSRQNTESDRVGNTALAFNSTIRKVGIILHHLSAGVLLVVEITTVLI